MAWIFRHDEHHPISVSSSKFEFNIRLMGSSLARAISPLGQSPPGCLEPTRQPCPQTHCFRTPARVRKRSQIFGRKLSCVPCCCSLRHVSLFNKSRDTAVILFAIAAHCRFSLLRSDLLLARPKQRISDDALGSPCAAPQPGAGADGLTERSREMALIGEPASLGNLHEGFVGI
jgi:hypothetical protein